MTDDDIDRLELESILLVARRPCITCDGIGDRVSDDWIAFDEWRQRNPGVASTQPVEHYFLQVCGYDSVPPERQPCGACDGEGKTDTNVPIEALVAFLLDRVDRPLLSRDELEQLVGRVRLAITHAAQASQGLMDPHDMGTWLRAVQEGAEALHSLQRLTAEPKDDWDV